MQTSSHVHRRVMGLALLLFAGCASVLCSAESSAQARRAGEADRATVHYLPNLQYPSCRHATTHGDRLEGMVGFGRYAAIISGSGALGVVARTGWSGDAAVAYEAPAADRAVILPLMMRNVYSHTTTFVVQNTVEHESRNNVRIEVFDSDSGASLVDVTAEMPRLAVYSYDTAADRPIFGILPRNAAAGFIGSVRFTSDEPVVVMAYGDEEKGDGTSSYVARPIAGASEYQYLPAVRAGYLGDSLIAIANPSRTHPVAVTITYRPTRRATEQPRPSGSIRASGSKPGALASSTSQSATGAPSPHPSCPGRRAATRGTSGASSYMPVAP